MPFLIVRNDIAKMETDAVVNPTHPGVFALSGRESGTCGGAEAALLTAGGPGLTEARRSLGTLSVGDIRVTEGYDLPARYVFHTAGPVYRGGIFGEEKLLGSCYRAALLKADELRLSSVAFPLVSSGTFGYPKRRALDTAVREIGAFLKDHEMTVFLVVYDKEAYEISRRLRKDIKDFLTGSRTTERPANAPSALRAEKDLLTETEEIFQAAFSDAAFPETQADAVKTPARREERPKRREKKAAQNSLPADSAPLPQQNFPETAFYQHAPSAAYPASSLRDFLDGRDESFSEMLLRKIDEKGMTDVECYKRANIDRKLFSKIRTNTDYRPKKATALAFAVALRLSLAETEELLRKAGFALSHASSFDLIIEYFIRAGKYDIYTINECLFEFDQPLLGA